MKITSLFAIVGLLAFACAVPAQTQTPPTSSPPPAQVTVPSLLTFAPGSSYSLSGLALPGRQWQFAADVSTPFARYDFGPHSKISLQSDLLAGAIIGGAPNVGYDAGARYDSRIRGTSFLFFASAGFGSIIPVSGGGSRNVLTGAIGITIAL